MHLMQSISPSARVEWATKMLESDHCIYPAGLFDNEFDTRFDTQCPIKRKNLRRKFHQSQPDFFLYIMSQSVLL